MDTWAPTIFPTPFPMKMKMLMEKMWHECGLHCFYEFDVLA
jgi:hypothetical protein